MQDRELHGEEALAIGQRVREQLARRRMSRQALADAARISLSTLEKVLAGTRPFTLATIIRIEEALAMSLRQAPATAVPADLAPDQLGAYSRAAVRWLEGHYLTLRPSFGTPDGIYAYRTEIAWNSANGQLGFQESGRLDAGFAQCGDVSMPNLSGHIYLVTNVAGQCRLITLGRPSSAGVLYGILAALQAGTGSQLLPIAAPICLSRIDPGGEPTLGLITPATREYESYQPLLNAGVREQFVKLYP